MVSEDHFYLLTSLDAHTVDLHSFKYGGTNFTAFRMIDTNHYEVKQVIKDIVTTEMNQGNRLQIEVIIGKISRRYYHYQSPNFYDKENMV